MKTCRKCKEEFPATLEFFYYDSKVKSGLRARCKACINEGNVATRDTDRHRDSVRIWRKNNPEKTAEQWSRANKKRAESGYLKEYYQKNKDTINSRRLAWGHRTGKFTEYAHKRRDAKGESVSKALWKEVLDAYGNHCLVPKCTNLDVTQDHVIPLKLGGRNHISNLQPLCGHHNCSKQSKTTDYRPDKGRRFKSDGM